MSDLITNIDFFEEDDETNAFGSPMDDESDDDFIEFKPESAVLDAFGL